MIKIANAQLWVHDQDEALAFYTEKLGMEVKSDVTLEELGNFRWLVVRYERSALNFLGFVQLGCILILLRQK